MTKIITYKCNICSDECTPDKIFGIYFEGTWKEHKIKFKAAREVEHHICTQCFDQIRNSNI